MSETPLSFIVVCPVCKATSMTTGSIGTIFKKTTYECNICHTILQQGGKGDNTTFTVIKVGEDYSNAESLLDGKKLKITELNTHNIPIVSDELLHDISQGKLDTLQIKFIGDAPPNVILRKNEKIILGLSPVNYLEERSKRISTGGGSFSVRVAKGFWYHTPRLSSPEYAESIEEIDNGWLVVTNTRYIFVGQRKNIDQPYTKVTAITRFKDGFGIARSNKQRTEFFTGGYHWPLIASILLGAVKNANNGAPDS